MTKLEMDKKIIIGFIVVFILGLVIGSRLRYEKTNLTMDQQMTDMMSPLKEKTGDDLDKAFLQQMIVHHQGAVTMAELLAKGTKRPELQKMAKDIIETQTKEIDQMDIWLTTWFSKK